MAIRSLPLGPHWPSGLLRRQDSELPSAPRLSRPLGYLTFSRFLQGAQRAERRAAAGLPSVGRPHFSPASAGLLQFSSRRAHYCDGSMSPSDPFCIQQSFGLEGHSYCSSFTLSVDSAVCLCVHPELCYTNLYTSDSERGVSDHPSERWCALFVRLCKNGCFRNQRYFRSRG